MTFKEQIQQGIPSILPQAKTYETSINHAPKRKEILSAEEKISLKKRTTLFRCETSCGITSRI